MNPKSQNAPGAAAGGQKDRIKKMGLKMGISGLGGSGVPVPKLGGAGWILGENLNPGTTTPSILCTTKPQELQLPASPAARQSHNTSQHALSMK